MNENEVDAQDFSDMTCTKMMILLKMRLRKTPVGTPVVFYVGRNQKDTVEVPFSRSGYDVQIDNADTDRYRITLTKRTAGSDP